MIGSEDLDDNLAKIVEDSALPVLSYSPIDEQLDAIAKLYDSLTEDDDIDEDDD